MKPKIKIILLILIPVFLFSFGISYAQTAPAVQRGLVGCTDNCTLHDLILVIIRIINLLLSLAGVVCMIFMVWAGWNMVTAAGNEEKIAGAKEILSNAIIGFFLVVIAYVLLEAILIILGGNNYTIENLFKFISNP